MLKSCETHVKFIEIHHFRMMKSDKSIIDPIFSHHFPPRNPWIHGIHRSRSAAAGPGSVGTSWRPSSTARAVGMRTTSPPGCSGTTSRRRQPGRSRYALGKDMETYTYQKLLYILIRDCDFPCYVGLAKGTDNDALR